MPVETKTLKHMVQPWHLELVNKPGFLFCRSPDCDVVYFHPDGTIPQRITAEVKAGNCACEIRNSQGSCCLGNVTAAVNRAMERTVVG